MDFIDFRKEYARKYRTPEEAVEVVKSGDWVDYTSNVGFPYHAGGGGRSRQKRRLGRLYQQRGFSLSAGPGPGQP